MRRNFTVDGASSLFHQREYYEQFSRYDFPPTVGDLIHFAASDESWRGENPHPEVVLIEKSSSR